VLAKKPLLLKVTEWDSPLSECPFNHMVPKDFAANLRFRKKMIQMGCASREDAREIWIMCSRDILFFLSTFGWTYDPAQERNRVGKDRKHRSYPKKPFIPWPFQEQAILEIQAAIGRYDLAVRKSRDMGASWMCLYVFLWHWLFHDLQSFLCLSRTEDTVDKTSDPDSLFWKLDYCLEHLPPFLVPAYDRTHLHIGNLDNGSSIDGGSTASDAGRGGRRTAILLDEFASVPDGNSMLMATQDATPCRIANSTPKGVGNAFSEICWDGSANKWGQILQIHWSLHPLKSLGLYYDGSGKPRSPWYDEQVTRAVHPKAIAQELDIDFLGSDFQFFDAAGLTKASAHVRNPFTRGFLVYDSASCQPTGFNRVSEGNTTESGVLKLWLPLDEDGRPPSDREYVIAVDPSMGTGRNNAAVSIGDYKTREKVGEWASPHVDPAALAAFVLTLARFFSCGGKEAYVIWEDNGPGTMLRKRYLDLGGKNFYRRKEKGNLPGWHSTVENKRLLLSEYNRALVSEEFINRSDVAIRECRQYVYCSDNSIKHSRANTDPDPSGAGENHADRVISDALLWMGLRERSVEQAKPKAEIPVNSFAGRHLAQYQKRTKVLRIFDDGSEHSHEMIDHIYRELDKQTA